MVWLECQMQFRLVSWDELKPGERIFYRIRDKDDCAHGPFVVVDPLIGRLRNPQGVELNLKRVQPLKLMEENYADLPNTLGPTESQAG